ncbi:hypothetical protein KP509_08G070600 [Ceratopteris richardii]|uniref:Uncharacterized protein n=1 Tax=Ceratopteris richardii TaxID=49495 RepID=A0A8T2U6P1_CERRI|nr:hypothetical protein KP509_08G070600 [Ceratopteris richardii]
MRGRIDPLKPMKRFRAEDEDEHQNELSVAVRLKQAIEEQEQTFVRLVDERRVQVRRLEEQARDIQFQLVDARRKLTEAESQLKKFRDKNFRVDLTESNHTAPSEILHAKVEIHSDVWENAQADKGISNQKPVLVIPGDKSIESSGVKTQFTSTSSRFPQRDSDPSQSFVSSPTVICVKSESGSSPPPNTSSSSVLDLFESNSGPASVHVKTENRGSSASRMPESSFLGSSKANNEDLVPHVGGSNAPSFLEVVNHRYLPSLHKRKLRSLCMNRNQFSSQAFATSALDGVINTWEIKDKGEGLALRTSIHCLSTTQKRWPEDLEWHPSGESIYACYSADAKDDQVAIIDLSADDKVKFLKERPHEKGIVNSITFLPWSEGGMFSTAGCDHAVVLWKEKETGVWKADALHRALHSSAVMSAVGMRNKPLIISVGMDKRVIGFDTEHAREEFRYILDNKALRMLSNPVDWNLYMVQTGTPGSQLRLFDVRSQRRELSAFGWRQDATESQSAHVHPSWSPCGIFIASGCADPKIHVFDIRYNGKEPSQTIKAHQRRVFKACWHHTFPLLISISSDLNVGLIKHRV